MFFKVLKKDFKRKKTMNILLLLFITFTATLLGASINMLSTNSTILHKYMDVAKVTDFFAVTHYSEDNLAKANEWLSTSKNIKEYSTQTAILLMQKDIMLPDGKDPMDTNSAMLIQSAPNRKNLLFDEENQPLVVNVGEIAIPYYIANRTNLAIGDKVEVNIEGRMREFTISHYVKDALMGSYMMNIKRWIINEEDFQFYCTEKATQFTTISVNQVEDAEKNTVAREYSQLNFPSVFSIDKSVIELSYIMNSMIAGIIMVVSFLLILISFLMLRFTIVFTLQEDYKEIGIMKAIGIKNHSIQSIYMVKYLAIGLIGGTTGYLLSLLVGATLINTNCSEMVTEKTGLWNLPSFLGVAVIIVLTLGFCRLCTRKVNKLSAITAIRGGSTGERYHKNKKIYLKRWKIRPSTFLAVSDLLHSGKKHIALFLSFVLGTMVLIITLNLTNTMKSPALLDIFGYAEFDFVVTPPDTNKIMFNYSTEELLSYVDELEKNYKDNSIPVELFTEVSYMCKIYKGDPSDSRSVHSRKSYGIDAKEYNMLEGTSPKLANEVAITRVVADYFNVRIGDRLNIRVGDNLGEYIISGIYSSMMNVGESIRLPQEASYELKGISSLTIMGRYRGSEKQENYLSQMRNITPNNEIEAPEDHIQKMMGNISDTLDRVTVGILFLVVCINFLITTMVCKLIVTKETPDIAVLKSTGFMNRSIRAWQIKRMTILLLIAILMGTVFANLLGGPVGNYIFNTFGAFNITLVVKPLQIYIIYPGIILIVTLVATYLGTLDIRKIQVRELNNQE